MRMRRTFSPFELQRDPPLSSKLCEKAETSRLPALGRAAGLKAMEAKVNPKSFTTSCTTALLWKAYSGWAELGFPRPLVLLLFLLPPCVDWASERWPGLLVSLLAPFFPPLPPKAFPKPTRPMPIAAARGESDRNEAEGEALRLDSLSLFPPGPPPPPASTIPIMAVSFVDAPGFSSSPNTGSSEAGTTSNQ